MEGNFGAKVDTTYDKTTLPWPSNASKSRFSSFSLRCASASFILKNKSILFNCCSHISKKLWSIWMINLLKNLYLRENSPLPRVQLIVKRWQFLQLFIEKFFQFLILQILLSPLGSDMRDQLLAEFHSSSIVFSIIFTIKFGGKSVRLKPIHKPSNLSHVRREQQQ